MNLARLLTGVIKVLGRSEDWPDHFDLSRKGLRLSFLALILSVPAYYLCAVAIQQHAARVTDTTPVYPTAPFFLILGLYALIFVVCAYIIGLVFDRMDRFRPWVITRHWAVFFAALLAAILAGLYMAGILPFSILYGLWLIIYLGTLAIDIRLASRLGGFDWMGAVFTGCIITAMSLTILLIGVAQLA